MADTTNDRGYQYAASVAQPGVPVALIAEAFAAGAKSNQERISTIAYNLSKCAESLDRSGNDYIAGAVRKAAAELKEAIA